jgi:hypothetical protein
MWLISEENGKKGSYTCPCPITKKKYKKMLFLDTREKNANGQFAD